MKKRNVEEYKNEDKRVEENRLTFLGVFISPTLEKMVECYLACVILLTIFFLQSVFRIRRPFFPFYRVPIGHSFQIGALCCEILSHISSKNLQKNIPKNTSGNDGILLKLASMESSRIFYIKYISKQLLTSACVTGIFTGIVMRVCKKKTSTKIALCQIC